MAYIASSLAAGLAGKPAVNLATGEPADIPEPTLYDGHPQLDLTHMSNLSEDKDWKITQVGGGEFYVTYLDCPRKLLVTDCWYKRDWSSLSGKIAWNVTRNLTHDYEAPQFRCWKCKSFDCEHIKLVIGEQNDPMHMVYFDHERYAKNSEPVRVFKPKPKPEPAKIVELVKRGRKLNL